ncbi:MAG: hypothetical protein ISS48_01220 [Candidatus Aenigmarchaeota archaeon]|nr:hypothetical protein [Candidatus Aenigmarchaeota archaeon]
MSRELTLNLGLLTVLGGYLFLRRKHKVTSPTRSLSDLSRKRRETVLRQIGNFYELPDYSDLKLLFKEMEGNRGFRTRFYGYLVGNDIYQLLNEEFVDELASLLAHLSRDCESDGPIVEICAGDGKLTYHLREGGLNIVATDDYSDRKIKRDESHVGELDYMRALEKYNPRIVVCSWLPYRSKLGKDVINYPSVKYLVTIGEGHGGTSGDGSIYSIADSLDPVRMRGGLTRRIDRYLSRKRIKKVNRYALCRSDTDIRSPNSLVEVFQKK